MIASRRARSAALTSTLIPVRIPQTRIRASRWESPAGLFRQNLTTSVRRMAFELPPLDTKRWVTRRKAIVVNAVRSGALSIQEACQRYSLSLEEFLAWQSAI